MKSSTNAKIRNILCVIVIAVTLVLGSIAYQQVTAAFAAAMNQLP